MAKNRIIPILFCLTLAACAIATPNESPTPTATLAPTEMPVLVDSFFFGHAYIDANGNSEIDASDSPLKGALFTAVDANGLSGGGVTDSKGNATAWWPGVSVYPVTLRMAPPEESGYTLIGETEIVLQAHETTGNFLFAPPE